MARPSSGRRPIVLLNGRAYRFTSLVMQQDTVLVELPGQPAIHMKLPTARLNGELPGGRRLLATFRDDDLVVAMRSSGRPLLVISGADVVTQSTRQRPVVVVPQLKLIPGEYH